ncbi:hypothetical protein [Natranaerobius trueperi]|uniref:hypothetical protein n=1 Tax=Natranaerobius trueperi TaxID=759412 RepID=UPI00130340AD|nr:hypothetical protein [Natranaerobius trueperi]
MKNSIDISMDKNIYLNQENFKIEKMDIDTNYSFVLSNHSTDDNNLEMEFNLNSDY